MIGSLLFRIHAKKFIGSAAAAAMISALAIAGLNGTAGADVARYQVETLQYTVTVAGTYVHSYTVTVDPCNGTFTATGQYPASPAAASVYEFLTGSTDGAGNLTFTSTYYNDPAFTSPTGYWWTFSGSFTDSNYDFSGTLTNSSSSQSGLTVTGTADSATFSSYANHGQYVSSVGGGNDAAHSCIGMPMQSRG
jgi:hypothetical protein